MGRKERQVRSVASKFETREAEGEKRIEGYFAVFNSDYHIADGLSESVASGAFTDTLGGDIRALIDHDSRLVLGRNTAHTLELRQDEHGLFGSILINPNDGDAMNLYARVQRGDVDQCSFGFDIVSEHYDVRGNGDVHWTIDKVKLYEVSVCTFPAYEETNVMARERDAKEIRNRSLEAWKINMRGKLIGGNEDAESADA